MAAVALSKRKRMEVEWKRPHIKLINLLYAPDTWLDHKAFFWIRPELVDRLERGEASTPSEMSADLVHKAYMHTLHIAGSYNQPDQYRRRLFYPSNKGAINMEDLTAVTEYLGPLQALDWERMRVLVVEMPVEVDVTCGKEWSPGAAAAAAADKQQPQSLLYSSRLSSQKVHILYDDNNCCLIANQSSDRQILYVARSHLREKKEAATNAGEKEEEEVKKKKDASVVPIKKRKLEKNADAVWESSIVQLKDCPARKHCCKRKRHLSKEEETEDVVPDHGIKMVLKKKFRSSKKKKEKKNGQPSISCSNDTDLSSGSCNVGKGKEEEDNDDDEATRSSFPSPFLSLPNEYAHPIRPTSDFGDFANYQNSSYMSI